MKNYGTVKINSINFSPPPPQQVDTHVVPPIIPSVSKPKPVAIVNQVPSFDVKLTYKEYKLIIRRRQLLQTNLIIEYTRNYRRVANKNVLKDVKDFVSHVTSKKQAGNLRKRIIALEKFGKIEDKEFRFLIE